MNKYIYHSETNSFYPVSLKDDYMSSGSWPESGVEISESEFIRFTNPPPGKYRVAGDDGYPAWDDVPPPTHEEQQSEAERKKQALINRVNEYINSKQWPGKAAIGRLKGEELAQYNLWLDYLDALELVDTSSAPDIEWPTPPAVQAR
ncbi:TPA: tail fiber assembly protein [Escherichia coli]|nr:tail fiber assembly protein [Escherichia coli]